LDPPFCTPLEKREVKFQKSSPPILSDKSRIPSEKGPEIPLNPPLKKGEAKFPHLLNEENKLPPFF
jgi:hypothetical protein